MKLYLLILFLVLGQLSANAQDSYDITYEDASLKFGAQASVNGLGLFFRNAVPLSKKKYRLLDISFSGVRHVKEKSVLNQRMVNTSPYIYGKVNRLYALRPMMGFQRTLADKHNKNSVGVNAFGIAGPTLGILKPIFVNVETFDPSQPAISISESVKYNPEIHKHERITGYSSFGRGLGESRLIPGVSAKAGVEFNWGYYSSEFKSLEIGVLIDYFPGRPKLMHFIKNKIIYSSFYLSFAFGKNY